MDQQQTENQQVQPTTKEDISTPSPIEQTESVPTTLSDTGTDTNTEGIIPATQTTSGQTIPNDTDTHEDGSQQFETDTILGPVQNNAIPPIEDIQSVQEPEQQPEEPITVTSSSATVLSPGISSLASRIMPVDITPDQATVFTSWLTKYQRGLQTLGTLGLKKKKLRHMDKLLELLGQHETLTQIELAHTMRLTTVTVGKYLNELIKDGRVRHVGPMHHGRYEKV